MAIRRVWLTAFLLIAVACAAWSFAYPMLGAPDEAQHAIRAAAVARGSLLGRHEDRYTNLNIVVDVPEAYTHADNEYCYWPTTDTLPDCLASFSGGSRLGPATTYEFRGPFFYYAVVGLPTLVFPSLTGLFLMRLVNVLICAALLASAFTVASRMRSLPLLVGVFAAVVPEVLFLGGVINTNSVEAAAAICLWTALAALIYAPEVLRKGLIRTAGVAGVVLVGSRGLSPLFFAICVVAIGVLIPRAELGRILRRRDVRQWALVVAIAAIVSTAWSVYVVGKYPLDVPGIGWSAALRQIPGFGRGALGDFVIQGRFLALRQVPLPVVVYVAWIAVVVVLLVGAMRSDVHRRLLTLVGLLVISIVIPVAGQAMGVGGQYWVGRHVLAVACGIPIVAGACIAPNRPRVSVSSARVWYASLVALVLAHVVAFGWTLHRFVVGGSASFNPFEFLFSPKWSPPLPPFVLVGAFAASLTALAVVLARATTDSDDGVCRR